MLTFRLFLLFSAVSLAACAHKDEAKHARAAPKTKQPSSSDGGATSRSVSNIVLGAQGQAPQGELGFVAGWRVVSFDGPKLGLDGATVNAECDWVRAVTVERDGERRRGSVLQPCEPRAVGVGGTPGRQGPALEDLVLGSAAVILSGAAEAPPEVQSRVTPQPRIRAHRKLEEGRPVKLPPRPSPLLFLDLSPDEALKIGGGPAQGPDVGRSPP